MSDKTFNLTRRKALLGLGGIGAGAALGGAGTMAFLNDPESIKNNTVTAGTLDLKLDWFTSYYGPHGVKYGKHFPPTDDDDIHRPMISLDDVKPGDHGCAVVSFHVSDNPAYIWFRPNNVSSSENGMEEPEEDAEGDLPGRGELEKHIKFVAAPLGCYKIHDDGSCDMSSEEMVKQEMDDGPVNVDNYTTDASVANSGSQQFSLSHGTLDDFYNDTKGGVRVPMWDHGHMSYKFEASHLCLFGFCWYLPKEVGNVIQGDSFSFDLDFYAEQYRHNSNPASPWNNNDNDSD